MKGREAAGAFMATSALLTLLVSAPAGAAGGAATASSSHALAAAAPAPAPRTFEPRGEPVQGASALIDAPVLTAGTYTDSLQAGESLWFAVDLERGDEVTARLTVLTAGVPSAATIALEWQDLSARRVDATRLASLPTGQASTLAVSTGLINGTRTSFGAVREPGRYYLNVTTAGFPAEAPHAFVLELFMDGRLNAPVPTGTTTSTPAEVAPSDATVSPTPTATSTRSLGEPTPAETTTDRALPPPPDSGAGGVIVLAGATLVTVLGGMLFLLRRRRLRAEESPPPPTYYG